MKLATQTDETTIRKLEIQLPYGLIGLADLKKFELSRIEGSPPFLLMRPAGGEDFDFIVVEPNGLIPGYEMELSDSDAESLQIKNAEDALILNILTVHSLQPQHVTVNLVGPIVLNRRTLVGQQVILANADLWSTHHALIDERNRAVSTEGSRPC